MALAWFLGRKPPAVRLSREVPGQGFEGTRVPYRVRIEIDTRRPLRVIVEDPTPLSVVSSEVLTAGGLTLGHTVTELDGSLTLNRRGEYAWPGGRVRWADPLGLFWRSVPLNVPATIEVYPGTHGLVLPDLLRPLLSEGQLSRTLGLEDPISLRGARPYVSGDPPGRVHWRLSARSGTLTVRELERTAASSLTVFVDTSGTDVFVNSAVRLASSLIQEALALDLPVSVATPAGATPSGRTPEALRAALRLLARLEPQDPRVVGMPLVIPPIRAGGNLMVLTQKAPPDLVEQAMRARASASRVAIVAIPEGFYLEPGENPRRQWVGAPDTVRELERRAGILAEVGVLVFVLRGNQSVLRLGA
ncbi:DUF58 domain-containing protein [Deinococcus sp. RL]|uniref:DUF58 domain-containing protein n=1 Tax=Deinococcus sp. RL TaxID=1489678 RepID=UPI000A6F7111|nr:DUF58 domain-containing protein [Deinococcus sp. RL]